MAFLRFAFTHATRTDGSFVLIKAIVLSCYWSGCGCGCRFLGATLYDYKKKGGG